LTRPPCITAAAAASCSPIPRGSRHIQAAEAFEAHARRHQQDPSSRWQQLANVPAEAALRDPVRKPLLTQLSPFLSDPAAREKLSVWGLAKGRRTGEQVERLMAIKPFTLIVSGKAFQDVMCKLIRVRPLRCATRG